MSQTRSKPLSRSAIKLLLIAVILGFAFFTISRPNAPATVAMADSQTTTPFHSFESPQIHPITLTPDGTKLLAVNSPNNSLSVFELSDNTPKLIAEIPVGLEPVSVAARTNSEVWIVNWLSDSISIVDLNSNNVVRTIDVGDEPTDIIFAGADQAYVCVSGTREIKSFNTADLNQAPKVFEIAGKQPRSLSTDPAGKNVFISIFESGNQTTIVGVSEVRKAGGLPAPVPALSPSLPSAPISGIIVKQKGKKFVDENGDGKWTQYIQYTLADNDLFIIDTEKQSLTKKPVNTIGTHIGNSVFDPASNRLFVINTESHNLVRFEPKVKGRFISSRVSTIDFSAKKPKVTAIDLNPHIDYNNEEGSAQERALTLGMPADIVRAANGGFYVAATSSDRIGVLDANGVVKNRINVGEGPTGLAIAQNNQQLFVLNRFEQTISIVDLNAQKELSRLPIGVNPEPESVRAGRRFLYSGSLSSHGDVSCASCHRNGHTDGLAWDLGDPTGSIDVVRSKNFAGPGSFTFNFHPMKGPMVTQSLRGIVGTEPFHWRGDRAKLENFDGAFVSLLGNATKPTKEDMASFEAFIKTLTYPPNPLQNLDRSYGTLKNGASAARGEAIYNGKATDRGIFTCNFCHTVSPGFGPGTNNLIIPGQLLFMIDGTPEPQSIKIPQLRGIYQKSGFENRPGKQLSGFGFAHDGVFDNLLTFLKTVNFTFANDTERKDVEAFVLSIDTGTAPSVGAQATINNTGDANAISRIKLLMNQSDRKNSELVVRGRYQGQLRGFHYVGNNQFQSDRSGEPMISLETLLQQVSSGAELTFTGVPPGEGRRIGIDSNLDGRLNGDQ